jgi:hypothetical protein
MKGTPPVAVTFSRSISRNASTVSHLCISTSLLPLASEPISVALQAVTWNSGITIRMVRGCGAGGISPRRNADCAPLKALDRMLVVRLRCVPSAPFGRPVVPLV